MSLFAVLAAVVVPVSAEPVWADDLASCTEQATVVVDRGYDAVVFRVQRACMSEHGWEKQGWRADQWQADRSVAEARR